MAATVVEVVSAEAIGDAMRGLTVAAMLIVNDAGDWDHVHPWLEHSAWNGCTCCSGCCWLLFHG